MRPVTSSRGKEGRPLSLHHCFSPWRKVDENSRWDGKTLFCREPSAMTRRSAGRFCPGEWPCRTQCSAEGSKLADRYGFQSPHTQGGVVFRPQSSIACLWLHMMSTTEECFTNMVFKEGGWQGTLCTKAWVYHDRRKLRRSLVLNTYAQCTLRKRLTLN